MKSATCEIDFWVLVQGTIGLVRPLTRAANEWIREHVPHQSQWFGPALVLEHRYIAALLNHMVEDGLQVRQRIVDDTSKALLRSLE